MIRESFLHTWIILIPTVHNLIGILLCTYIKSAFSVVDLSMQIIIIIILSYMRSMRTISGDAWIDNVKLNDNKAYMRQWTRSALVQIMFCRMFGAKPLSDFLSIGPLASKFSEILIKTHHFSFMKIHLKMSSSNNDKSNILIIINNKSMNHTEWNSNAWYIALRRCKFISILMYS